MITPVGIAYQWRMLADMNKGPFSELWNWVGLGEFAGDLILGLHVQW